MIDCWASHLSDCCDVQSREHLISASLFSKSKSIFVQGFPWCVDTQKEIGLSSLTSKILCKHHNSSLSLLDSAAGHAFNNFEFISKLILEANNNRGRFKIKESHINAVLLERWLLKTLINISYRKDQFIGNSCVAGLPEDNLVKICFGKSTFSNGAGMYIAANQGDNIEFGSELILTPLIEESENKIVGGMFEFAGLLIFLWLLPEKLPNNFNWIKNLNPKWNNVQPSRPFRKIKFKIPSGQSHVLHFHW